MTIKKIITRRYQFLIAFSLITKAIFFFLDNKQFYLYWDYLGHLQKTNALTWPWQGGWDTLYWGGYSTLNYPSLSHYLLKGLLLIIPSPAMMFAILIIVSLIAITHSLWLITNKYLKKYSHQLLAYTITILVFVLSPIGAITLKGFLIGGIFTAAMAQPIFLYLITRNKWYEKGWLLGVLLLTHALTASVAILYLTLEFLLLLINKKFYLIKNSLYTFLLGLIIGLSWILPLLDNSFHHSSFGVSGKPFIFGIIFSILLLISVIKQLIHKKLPEKLLLFTTCLSILALLPNNVVNFIDKNLIRGIHFYRYYTFTILLTPIALIKNLSLRSYTTRLMKNINNRVMQIFATMTAIFIILMPISPIKHEFTTYFSNLPSNLQGRFLDISNTSDLSYFIHTADHLLPINTTLIGSTGLFFESSETGIYYAISKHILNANSFSVPINEIYVQKLSEKINDLNNLENLLGINYLIYTSVDENESAEQTYTFAKIKTSFLWKQEEKWYHLKKINDNQLIEILNQPLQTDTNLDIYQWWGDENKQLLARQNHTIPAELNLNQPVVTDYYQDTNTIKFNIKSDQPAPVLIKFSYSPYWVAMAENETSFTTQPIWITPNNMLIYGYGKIKLGWQTPKYVTIFAPISWVTLILTSIYIWVIKTNSRSTRV